MTIQEAIRSEKEFKRKHWGVWIAPDEFSFVYTVGSRSGENHPLSGEDVQFDQEDLLATDWEVKE